MSLDFTDTTHPIYGHQKDMVTAVLCSCWKGAQVLLVFVPKAYLGSSPKLVPQLLPWKLQHKHERAQTSSSPRSKDICIQQEPYKVSVQQALSAKAVRLPASQQTQRYEASPLGPPLPATPLPSGFLSSLTRLRGQCYCQSFGFASFEGSQLVDAV